MDQIPLFDDLPADPWVFDPLPRGAFDILVADPPWTWSAYSNKGLKKSAQRHYSCMTLEDIKALPVIELAAQTSILLLWATIPMLPHAIDTMTAWGWSYKSHMIWRKVTASGKLRMGTGFWCRSLHEAVLIGTRGKPKLFPKAMPSLFDGVARGHSRKPDEFYALLRARSEGRRCADLFARERREGFSCWGDQVDLFNQGVDNVDGCGQSQSESLRSQDRRPDQPAA
jgi:N6-adenosine-specific RNA methylase IME4